MIQIRSARRCRGNRTPRHRGKIKQLRNQNGSPELFFYTYACRCEPTSDGLYLHIFKNHMYDIRTLMHILKFIYEVYILCRALFCSVSCFVFQRHRLYLAFVNMYKHENGECETEYFCYRVREPYACYAKRCF